jgi:predicted TIM-barrel fold metal-dependent hydrolase
MTRKQFLRTALATATAFAVMNKVYGLDSSGGAAAMPLGKDFCNDLDAARERLDRKFFVVDVQQHHADIPTLSTMTDPANVCFLRFVGRAACQRDPNIIGQLNYIKEVFVDSQTDVGVISGLPGDLLQICGPSAMAATRDLVNELAGSERAISQVVCDPKAPPSRNTSIDTLEYQVRELKGRALKCYTYSDSGWRLDDDNGNRMIAEAHRLGLRLVNVHKGLPAIFAPGSPETVRTIDFPGVVQTWQDMKFCAYHSGFFQDGTHPEGLDGLTEWLQVIQSIPPKLRKNVYTEIGSTFAFTFLDGDNGPEKAAHLLGSLLKALGPKNILWGTDCIWWGSPQFLIDAFMCLEISEKLQNDFGYPPLTLRTKKRILGENAAKLYRLKPKQKRRPVDLDRLQQVQVAQGGHRAGRSLRWYGAQTRREFLALFGKEHGLVRG